MEMHWHPTTTEIVFAVLLMVLPWAFSDMPVIWKCVMLFIAWLLLAHLGFVFVPFLTTRPLVAKLAFAVGLTGLLVGFTYPKLSEMWIVEKASALSGDLIAKNDGKDRSSELPILQFGPTGGSLPPWSGPVDVPMIQAYYDKILIKRVNGRLELTTTVRDDNKDVIVDVTRNHWTINPTKSVSWHNYTDDALEVKDGKQRVVFQVRVLPDRIQLQQEWQWNKGIPSGGIFEHGKYSEKEGIKPIFKYPSEEFWGKLNQELY